MTTIEIKPSNHNIDATPAQCQFLNTLGEQNRRHRQALVHLKDSCERELNGTRWGLPHQTMHEVVKFQGAVDVLLTMIFSVFTVPEEQEAHDAQLALIKGWVDLAMEENVHGMGDQNWFFPPKQ